MSVNQSESRTALADYEASMASWRQEKDDSLTNANGWLALIGLFWLEEGPNTVGGDPRSAVPLTQGVVPEHLGTLTLNRGVVTLDVEAGHSVMIGGAPATHAELRDDHAPEGPTTVRIGTVSFYVIRRGELYGIRARDSANPARAAFKGRKWFPLRPDLRIPAAFEQYETPRIIQTTTSTGIVEALKNIGRAHFELDGQPQALEAFESGKDLWFILRDGTSGKTTYGGGRFLYAPLDADGQHLTLDFNQTYHPPCVFTPYATCPLPPPQNHLHVPIEAGERY